MNVEIGTEAAQFPEKEYQNGIFLAVWLCVEVVDMRWGVRDEMTNEHMTTALCMNELRQDTMERKDTVYRKGNIP
jgi:hypothetical protein